MNLDRAAQRSMRAARSYAFVLAATLVGCVEQPDAAFKRLFEANQLAADLSLQFTSASDAANRSVMADTDQTSIDFAHEAEHASSGVELDLARLDSVLSALQFSDELQLLHTFRDAFAKYRALDSEILKLAVVNSNLKAQRLSFGPAREEATAFAAALEPFVHAEDGPSWHTRALADEAMLALREIEVLQAPHIAEPLDPVMDRLEQQMAGSEHAVRAALDSLAMTAAPELRSHVADARAALDRFMKLNAELVALSRRNSNVRSLALSLGQKRTLNATCDAALHALRDRLAQHKLAGTR